MDFPQIQYPIYSAYEEITKDGKINVIRRLADGAFIPVAEGNSDYQTYLLDKDAGATVTQGA